LTRAAASSSGTLDARILYVALFEQFPVAHSEFPHASRQGPASFFHFLIRHFVLSLNEQQIQMVAEIKPLPTARSQEIGNLQSRNATSPRKETPRGVEFLEFFPENQRSLLKKVVGIAQIADERMNITI
jgi:hypothetical protein